MTIFTLSTGTVLSVKEIQAVDPVIGDGPYTYEIHMNSDRLINQGFDSPIDADKERTSLVQTMVYGTEKNKRKKKKNKKA